MKINWYKISQVVAITFEEDSVGIFKEPGESLVLEIPRDLAEELANMILHAPLK